MHISNEKFYRGINYFRGGPNISEIFGPVGPNIPLQSHACITCDKKRFSASDTCGLRVLANISPLISTTGINHGLNHVKCVEVLVRRSSLVCKLAST